MVGREGGGEGGGGGSRTSEIVAAPTVRPSPVGVREKGGASSPSLRGQAPRGPTSTTIRTLPRPPGGRAAHALRRGLRALPKGSAAAARSSAGNSNHANYLRPSYLHPHPHPHPYPRPHHSVHSCPSCAKMPTPYRGGCSLAAAAPPSASLARETEPSAGESLTLCGRADLEPRKAFNGDVVRVTCSDVFTRGHT